MFETSRSERWLVQLGMRCPGLTPSSQVALEKDQFRLCEFDSVRVAYSNPFGGIELGPRCQLARFESVTDAQITVLREQLKGDKSRTQTK
ncbi:MAG: hypothetical protein HC809_07575 [Gammaproteobacteria bacterium]|nr:hypothetical protein [Gammaproteobacteria bacterium]